MEKHANILGILFIALGVMGLIGASVVFIIFVGGGFFTSVLSGENIPAIIAGIIGLMIISIIVLTSMPAIIAGYGVMRLKPWGRILAIIVAALSILNIPFGTAVGVYALWVLFNDETVKLFEAQSARIA